MNRRIVLCALAMAGIATAEGSTTATSVPDTPPAPARAPVSGGGSSVEWVSGRDDTGTLSIEAPVFWTELSTPVTDVANVADVTSDELNFLIESPTFAAVSSLDDFYGGLDAGRVSATGVSVHAVPFNSDPMAVLAYLPAHGVSCTGQEVQEAFERDGLVGVHIVRTGCEAGPDLVEGATARIDLVVVNPTNEQYSVGLQLVTMLNVLGDDDITHIIDSLQFNHDADPPSTEPIGTDTADHANTAD